MVRSKIRVLLLIKGLGSGGAEQLLLQMVGSTGDTLENHVGYVDRTREQLREKFSQCADSVTLLSDAGPGFGNRLTSRLSRVLRIRSWIRQHAPAVVHIHSPALAVLVRLLRLAGLLGPVAIVYTEHSPWEKYHWITRFLNRLTYQLDDYVFCVSEETYQLAVAKRKDARLLVHGINIEKVREIRNSRQEAREQWGVGDDIFVVGMVANFRPEKNHLMAIGVMDRLTSVYPDIQFRLYGQGVLLGEVTVACRNVANPDKIVLFGYTDEPVKQMSGLDSLILPSSQEGLPVTLMEASVLGLPVVVTRLGGVERAFDENEVLYMETPEADQLYSSVKTLYEDKPLRDVYSENIKKRCARFDRTHFVREYVSAYRHLMEERA